MKKIAILLSVLALGSLFAGCLTAQQEITFTTQAYAYLVPSTDTLDFTTAYDTNAYISKVVCADEETLNVAGPALMSAYSKPETPVTGVAFNLALTKLDKFDGNLCDVYVTAYDESTTEEIESIIRVNIGAKPAEVVETEEVCSEETGECPVTDDGSTPTTLDEYTGTLDTSDTVATDTTTDTVTE